MPSTRSLAGALAVAVLLPLSLSAQAFPIASPGSEGFVIVANSSSPIVATYLGNSAAFSDDLFLAIGPSGQPGIDGNFANDVFIFNNQLSPFGSTFNLGSFAPGTELIFRLFVHNTGQSYYSGPASRNPDNMPHARVQSNWLPGTTLVSFEDLLNDPEGANGFNDLSFSFTNTFAATAAPEPTTLVLLAGGLFFVGVVAGKRRLFQS